MHNLFEDGNNLIPSSSPGTLISSMGEVNASPIGLMLFMASSLSEATRVVIIQFVLQVRADNMTEGRIIQL